MTKFVKLGEKCCVDVSNIKKVWWCSHFEDWELRAYFNGIDEYKTIRSYNSSNRCKQDYAKIVDALESLTVENSNSLLSGFNQFMFEHRSMIYWSIVMLVVDQIFFKGKLQEKLLKAVGVGE